MEAVTGAWRTDLREGTRPTIRNKHSSNSHKLHRHEQSYPRTDMTSQTQRLLLISVYPTDWVWFMLMCVSVFVCVCERACVCIPVRLYLPVHVCLHALALLCLCACVCQSARLCVYVSFHGSVTSPSCEVGLASLSSHTNIGGERDVKINTHTHTPRRR